MPKIRQAAGLLYAVTALVSAYWEFSLMLRLFIGGPWSWWYMIMLGASVLLLVGGVHIVAPQIRGGWLVALAAMVPLLLWSLFRHWSWVWLVFTLATAMIAWGTLFLAAALQKPWVVSLIASVLLAIWWVPASVRALSAYFSPKPTNLDPTELIWALTPCLLVILSLIAGAFLARTPRTDRNAYTYDAPH
jgi:hypothetical protein